MLTATRPPQLKTVLIATGVILTLAMGVRHGFGMWMQPISQSNGWSRETYSLAMALQNLMWGALGALAGGFADRYGPGRVIERSVGIQVRTNLADGIYRLSTFVPEVPPAGFSFNQFLIETTVVGLAGALGVFGRAQGTFAATGSVVISGLPRSHAQTSSPVSATATRCANGASCTTEHPCGGICSRATSNPFRWT